MSISRRCRDPASIDHTHVHLFKTVATAAALVATSLGVGYALGQRSVLAAKATKSAPEPTTAEAIEESESESDEEDLADGDLSAVKPGYNEPCKLVGHRRVFRRLPG